MKTRRPASSLLIFGLMAIASSVALAQSPEARRKEIQVAANKISAALKKKDMKTLLDWYTPDYIQLTASGKKLTKPELEATIKAQMQQVTITSADYKVEKVSGDGPFFMTDTTLTVEMTGPGPDGKPHKLKLITKSMELFTKINKVWKLKYAEPRPGGKTFVDGHEVMKPGQVGPGKALP